MSPTPSLAHRSPLSSTEFPPNRSQRRINSHQNVFTGEVEAIFFPASQVSSNWGGLPGGVPLLSGLAVYGAGPAAVTTAIRPV